MRRGEIWIGSGNSDYTGKPRPQLVVQSDLVEGFESIVVCPITAFPVDAHALRIWLKASDDTGLDRHSWIMIDKISALPRSKLSKRIGALSIDQMDNVTIALVDLLALAR